MEGGGGERERERPPGPLSPFPPIEFPYTDASRVDR